MNRGEMEIHIQLLYDDLEHIFYNENTATNQVSG